jgi:hypothetical protein
MTDNPYNMAKVTLYSHGSVVGVGWIIKELVNQEIGVGFVFDDDKPEKVTDKEAGK